MSVLETPPSGIIRPAVLSPTRIIVRVCLTNPEIVEIVIGNSSLKIGYEDALTLSQNIRVTAKEAKRLCGDNSRSWRVLGNLTAKQD